MYDLFIFGAVFSDLTWIGLSIVAFGMGFNIYKMIYSQKKEKNLKLIHRLKSPIIEKTSIKS